MASLHLTNLPEDLLCRLQQRATDHGRTLEQEAMRCLDEALGFAGSNVQTVNEEIEELRKFRASLGPDVFLTEDDLQHAKREGRE